MALDVFSNGWTAASLAPKTAMPGAASLTVPPVSPRPLISTDLGVGSNNPQQIEILNRILQSEAQKAVEMEAKKKADLEAERNKIIQSNLIDAKKQREAMVPSVVGAPVLSRMDQQILGLQQTASGWAPSMPLY